MSGITLNVQRLASRPFARPLLFAAVILSLGASLASPAQADVLQGAAGSTSGSFLIDEARPFTTDLRDLDFPGQAAYASPIHIFFSDTSSPDPRTSANPQAADDTPFLIEAFISDRHFESWVAIVGPAPSYYSFYDDSLNAIQVKSMGSGSGPSFLIDNIEMTTLGSTVPEPNTLLLLSSAMLVLGVGLRCLFARD
jgi:hypothetical protein